VGTIITQDNLSLRSNAVVVSGIAFACATLVACGGAAGPVVHAEEHRAEPTASTTPAPSVSAAPYAASPDETAIILVTTGDRDSFCDGSKMDSAGYRKTLTREKRVKLPPHDATRAGKAKAVAIVAAERCSDAFENLRIDFVVDGRVLRIPPIPSWAGVGIALCTCKPDVEVNLLRHPGIARVVWE
jgi:hypothetical protein